MDPTRFNSIARLFAGRHLSRRQAVRQSGASLGRRRKDRVLVRPVVPVGPHRPQDGADGTSTLTLEHGLGQTLYFSDRSERIVGTAPAAQFLKGMPFGAANPPSAALVVEAGPGDEDVSVLEFANPTYDECTKTATYDAKALKEWERTLELGFSAAHLFVDDCPDITTCYTLGVYPAGPVPGGPIGTCWSSWLLLCQPCNGRSIDQIQQHCNQTYPDKCGGSSIVYTA
jgi:hypothetical protein